MESYNLSVVNIIPDAHLATIDQITDLYDLGAGNFTIKLINAAGEIYWGCHTRERMFDLPQPPDIPNAAEALSALYERVVLDGVPMDNWNAALAELGLSQAE